MEIASALTVILFAVFAVIGIALTTAGIIVTNRASRKHSTGYLILGTVLLYYGICFILGTILALFDLIFVNMA